MYDSIIDLLIDGDFADRDAVRSKFCYDSICALAKEKAAVGAATDSEITQ